MDSTAEPADQFSRAARAASAHLIDSYSTSFGWAVRLLGPRHRRHIRSIYALARVADEIVDGAAAGFGLQTEEQRAALDHYENAAHAAMRSGYSTDLVLHSFARSARTAGIDRSLTEPFFASMRADLDGSPIGSGGREAYVYGSAEVVGLMCLKVFLRDDEFDADAEGRLVDGARKLGAAFQNINFLRDLEDDSQRLGRNYLTDAGRLSSEEHGRWVSTIRDQLAGAAAVIPLLPRDCRVAVLATHMMFSALLRRLTATPTEELYRRRVRVPNHVKVGLVAGAVVETHLLRRMPGQHRSRPTPVSTVSERARAPKGRRAPDARSTIARAQRG